MTDQDRITAILEKARLELGEYCNAVLLVVSFETGPAAAIICKGHGQSTQIAGLAHYALWDCERQWGEAETENLS